VYLGRSEEDDWSQTRERKRVWEDEGSAYFRGLKKAAMRYQKVNQELLPRKRKPQHQGQERHRWRRKDSQPDTENTLHEELDYSFDKKKREEKLVEGVEKTGQDDLKNRRKQPTELRWGNPLKTARLSVPTH